MNGELEVLVPKGGMPPQGNIVIALMTKAWNYFGIFMLMNQQKEKWVTIQAEATDPSKFPRRIVFLLQSRGKEDYVWNP